jgi:hypothetical protein
VDAASPRGEAVEGVDVEGPTGVESDAETTGRAAGEARQTPYRGREKAQNRRPRQTARSTSCWAA